MLCWQIEWSFRFEKCELGIEHIRVRNWEAHLKFLTAITLVYAFLLSLLELASAPGRRFNRSTACAGRSAACGGSTALKAPIVAAGGLQTLPLFPFRIPVLKVRGDSCFR